MNNKLMVIACHNGMHYYEIIYQTEIGEGNLWKTFLF